MKPLCVLFIHHADDELTRFHADSIVTLNPAAVFVPLTFRMGFPAAVRPLTLDVGDVEHWNVDRLVYHWFLSPNRVDAARYLIIEYDTLCTSPFCEFYQEVWDRPVAGASFTTWATEPGWYWFQQISTPEIFQDKLAGIIPISGILLSHSALSTMAELAAETRFDPLYCECRIGTLANTTGFPLTQIRADAQDYIHWKVRVPDRPGIWHPVKMKTTLPSH
jgi:hypothetical protein